jgi:hypothetical protein
MLFLVALLFTILSNLFQLTVLQSHEKEFIILPSCSQSSYLSSGLNLLVVQV